MSEPIATMRLSRPFGTARVNRLEGSPHGYDVVRYQDGLPDRPLDVHHLGEQETPERAVVAAILHLGLSRGEQVRILFGDRRNRYEDAGWLLDQWTHPDDREDLPR